MAQPGAPAAAPRNGSQLLSREEAKALADRVLALSSADQTRVNITTQWSGNTRFADGSITTSGSVTNTTVIVTVTAGKRQASASTNVLDEASLKRTVDLAARLAQLAPEDPELMPELGLQTYAAVNGFSQETAELDAESRAAAIRRAVTAATSAGNAAGRIFTAGYLETNARVVAVATSRGLFAYHRTTDADFSMTARTPDGTGSGWARTAARDWGGIDTAALGRIAAQKAVASRNPQTIEPGMYTAVLEPQAVTDLIPLLAGALNARNADEGRSPFSKPDGGTRIGEKVADDRVTLYSDPADRGLSSQPFDNQGFPIGRTVWIEKGVLKNLAYTRFWAQKQGARPTGAPLAGGLALVGGSKTTEELIAGWYARHPRNTLLLHPCAGSADGAADRTHTRRDVPDRERQDHTCAEELPLERKPAPPAEPPRGPRPARADRGRPDDAGAAGAGLRLYVAL